MSTQISKRELLSKHALSAGLGVGALGLLPQRASADTPFTSFPFTATGAPTRRTMPDRLAEIINVKDYGAVGDGATDDTHAIQAAFDEAFGSWSSPHGHSTTLNKPVFFPAGGYLVRSAFAAPVAITDCQPEAVTNRIRLTVANTGGLVDGDMVYVRGVTGTTFANGSYSITNVDATHLTLVSASGGVRFNAPWTGGGTVCPPALRLKSVKGARIFGAGKGATFVASASKGCACISTNGFEYSSVEHIFFSTQAGGIAFDLNCDGYQVVNNQSNYFINCGFGGTGSSAPEYGCAIGMAQSMGSENTFLDCYVATGTIAGLSWHNFNALAGTVIGGNIASSSVSPGYGIYVVAGACPIIHGVSFQNYTGIDIYIKNGADDAYAITGCRSESSNFVKGPADIGYNIIGCVQLAAPGFFFSGSGRVTIDGCISTQGYIEYNPFLIINNSDFKRADYLTAAPNGHNFRYLQINPMPITVQTGSSYSIQSHDGGTKIQFNRRSAQTVTLNKNSDNTCALGVGTKIEVQQTGTGQTTFQGAAGVTIKSANGLKLRAQYSCATLTCDGTDTWTLTGDTSL
jgi:Pectate lyase superfamily protein